MIATFDFGLTHGLPTRDGTIGLLTVLVNLTDLLKQLLVATAAFGWLATPPQLASLVVFVALSTKV
jgi:hypothetical protein